MEIDDHKARVTCIKFSKDYQFLFTCDARGVIHHYQRNCHKGDEVVLNFESNLEQSRIGTAEERKQNAGVAGEGGGAAGRTKESNKSAFPFTMLYKVHD